MVKCSVGVGMWSTCKVVHHVHAAGALVHQAAQAHPLQARSCGGLGEGRRWRARWRRERSGAQPGAPAPGLVSVSTTSTNFFVLQKQKNVVQFYEKELQIWPST